MNDIPRRQIRALHDAHTIRVYQAYSHPIADAALSAGTFTSSPFSMTRMTWIKPSFLWMMYRAGWGMKDAGQACILAIDIHRDGFEWALAHSCPSHPDPAMGQQDPERDLDFQPLPQRAIQIGLSQEAVALYAGKWIEGITASPSSPTRFIHWSGIADSSKRRRECRSNVLIPSIGT